MVKTAFPGMIFKACSMPRITCMTCGDTMLLSEIEPASPGFDIRSFACMECNVRESFVVEIGARGVI